MSLIFIVYLVLVILSFNMALTRGVYRKHFVQCKKKMFMFITTSIVGTVIAPAVISYREIKQFLSKL